MCTSQPASFHPQIRFSGYPLAAMPPCMPETSLKAAFLNSLKVAGWHGDIGQRLSIEAWGCGAGRLDCPCLSSGMGVGAIAATVPLDTFGLAPRPT